MPPGKTFPDHFFGPDCLRPPDSILCPGTGSFRGSKRGYFVRPGQGILQCVCHARKMNPGEKSTPTTFPGPRQNTPQTGGEPTSGAPSEIAFAAAGSGPHGDGRCIRILSEQMNPSTDAFPDSDSPRSPNGTPQERVPRCIRAAPWGKPGSCGAQDGVPGETGFWADLTKTCNPAPTGNHTFQRDHWRGTRVVFKHSMTLLSSRPKMVLGRFRAAPAPFSARNSKVP